MTAADVVISSRGEKNVQDISRVAFFNQAIGVAAAAGLVSWLGFGVMELLILAALMAVFSLRGLVRFVRTRYHSW